MFVNTIQQSCKFQSAESVFYFWITVTNFVRIVKFIFEADLTVKF